MAQTFNEDQMFAGVVVRFFDNHTPPRPAKIDVSDRQPLAIFDNPSVASAANLSVASDGMSLTVDVLAGATGDTPFSIDADVNLANGTDDSRVFKIDDLTTTPAPAGPAASAAGTFPAATPKP